MKKKKLIMYFDQEWKDMKSCLRSYLKKEDPEDLHKFRLQVKKLQAFLILLDHTGHNEKLVPYFKPINKVFKHAGELRDAYMVGTITQVRQPADKAAQNFRALTGKQWKSVKKVHRTLKRKITPIKNKPVRHFYRHQLWQIERSLMTLTSGGRLHKCRKQIKFLLYNYQLAHGTLNVCLDTAYLQEMQEVIGNWHDQLLIRTLAGQDAAIINQADDRRSQLKAAIYELARNFYQRATIGTVRL